MKKSYFFLNALFLTSLSFNSVYSQQAYVAGTAKVKVNESTLVYFGGGLTLKNEVNQEKVVENAGNIIINGSYANTGQSAGADGKNFVSTWTDDTNYGQVIIQQGVTTTSKLTMEKGAIDPDIFSWGQFAIPYNFANPEAAMQGLFGSAAHYSNGSSRYYASMMKWDNLQKPEFDNLKADNSAGSLQPGDYVILNLSYFSANVLPVMIDAVATGKLPYSGVPTNKNYPQYFNVASYPDPVTYPTWNDWRNLKNSYNERYYTYIFDDVRAGNSSNYGRNFFQFGNPYTSNIDLSYIGTSTNDDDVYIADLMSVSKIGDENWNPDHDPGSQASTVTSTVRAVWNGSSWSGNPDALIIKPFETFIIGLTGDADRTSDSRSFSFNDKLKTFSSTPGAGSFSGSSTTDDKMNNNSLLSLFSATSATKNIFYQLGLRLYDSNDKYANNEVYVVVASSSKVQNGVADKYESEYADFDGRTGFYLAQENANGSEVTTTDRKLYINAVNVQYAAKPIQLFFNRKANDYEGYYLKADLFYGDIFNRLESEDINYPGNNSFYFYDKFEDVLLPITTEFSYYVELSDNPVESRYQVFWNGGPQQNKIMDTEEILPSSQTFIYKDQERQMVRFNEGWSTAEIKVYDLSGRNILTHEGVKTDSDFELKLPTKGVFVVKILSNTGEVYTQKIINQ